MVMSVALGEKGLLLWKLLLKHYRFWSWMEQGSNPSYESKGNLFSLSWLPFKLEVIIVTFIRLL